MNMLIYKIIPPGPPTLVVIPKPGGVDNLIVDIFIDSPSNTSRLYYSYDSPITALLKQRKMNWLKHDCGVLPEYFADRLLGGVRAVKVIHNSHSPITLRINLHQPD